MSPPSSITASYLPYLMLSPQRKLSVRKRGEERKVKMNDTLWLDFILNYVNLMFSRIYKKINKIQRSYSYEIKNAAFKLQNEQKTLKVSFTSQK